MSTVFFSAASSFSTFKSVESQTNRTKNVTNKSSTMFGVMGSQFGVLDLTAEDKKKRRFKMEKDDKKQNELKKLPKKIAETLDISGFFLLRRPRRHRSAVKKSNLYGKCYTFSWVQVRPTPNTSFPSCILITNSSIDNSGNFFYTYKCCVHIHKNAVIRFIEIKPMCGEREKDGEVVFKNRLSADSSGDISMSIS